MDDININMSCRIILIMRVHSLDLLFNFHRLASITLTCRSPAWVPLFMSQTETKKKEMGEVMLNLNTSCYQYVSAGLEWELDFKDFLTFYSKSVSLNICLHLFFPSFAFIKLNF